MNTKKGFTLIETIIYIGIIAIIISSFLMTSEQIIFSNNRTYRQIELTENQKFVIQKINWLLRNVDTINTPPPEASSTILSINKVNFADNPLVLSLADNVVYLNTTPLTNNSVIVTNLTFYQLTLTGQNAIRIVANMQNDVASSTIDRFILIK
jgi:type II secretory pathway pseudopilin PulG